MFQKFFKKTAAWGGVNKPFPHGIVEAARKSYNKKVLEKATKHAPAPAVKMVTLEALEKLKGGR